MLSLQDEISKFQKLIYNKELGEFITIDQMFVGRGITIESLIKQNNFIIQQLKKMSGLFKNFCKLNDKIYAKIICHELTAIEEQNRLNTAISTVDRRISEAVTTIKQLHEDTLYENAQSKVALTQIADPLRVQIAKKVDTVTFSTRMKQVMEEYDQGGHFLGQEDSNRTRTMLDDHGVPQIVSAKKRGKGIAQQQFQSFKKQIYGLLSEQDGKIIHNKHQIDFHADLLHKHGVQVHRNIQESAILCRSIDKLQQEHETQTALINATSQNLMIQISGRTSQSVWNARFEHFNEKAVRPAVSSLQRSMADHLKSNNAQLANAQAHRLQLDGQIKKNANCIAKNQAGLKQHEKTLAQILQDNSIEAARVNEKFKAIDQQIKKTEQELIKAHTIKYQELSNRSAELNETIKLLSFSIEQTVLRAVTKKNQAQIKGIETQIRTATDAIKDLQKSLANSFDQINSIKDVVAKKANFTDILLHFERKADRQDLKELKSKMESPSNSQFRKNQNFSGKTLSTTRRKTSLSKTSKSLHQPFNASFRNQGGESTRLFMCGLDDQIMPENRQIFSHNERRKSLRLHHTTVNDFNLA